MTERRCWGAGNDLFPEMGDGYTGVLILQKLIQ